MRSTASIIRKALLRAKSATGRTLSLRQVKGPGKNAYKQKRMK